MPLATNKVDTNRTTSGIALTPEMSNEIWANAVKESAVMQLARKVSLPGNGVSVPIITGEPTADFVNETAEKPVSASTFGLKTMTPYKIAVIELFSDEFRRDKKALYDELVRRLPYAIARKFDSTVFHGAAPGTGFDVLTGSTAVALAAGTAYDQLVAVKSAIAVANAELNGWILAPQGETVLLSAKGTDGHPLFIPNVNADAAISRIFSAPVKVETAAYASGSPNTIGFAGDWDKAAYGIVDGINIGISDQATINDGTQQINLWQRNMFAVRAEAEVSFAVKDAAAFVKLTD